MSCVLTLNCSGRAARGLGPMKFSVRVLPSGSDRTAIPIPPADEKYGSTTVTAAAVATAASTALPP